MEKQWFFIHLADIWLSFYMIFKMLVPKASEKKVIFLRIFFLGMTKGTQNEL